MEFAEPDNNFVPYDQLTEEQVIQWVQDSLGQEQVANLQSQLSQAIILMSDPKEIVAPLPWTH